MAARDLRRMRSAVWSVGLILLMTGCMDAQTGQGNDDGPPHQGPEPRHKTLPIDLPSCRMVEAVVLVDADEAERHIPDGFAVAEQEGQVAAVLGGVSCAGDSLPTARVFLAIAVTPTHDALRADGTTNYFWEPEHILLNMTGYTTTAASLGAHYTPTEELRVDKTLRGAQVVAAVMDGSHTIDAVGLTAGGPLADQFGHFREYSAAAGGYTYLEATYRGTEGTTTGTGLATLQTAPDTASRDLIGAEATGPVLYAENIAFADASLGFVPWPPGEA